LFRHDKTERNLCLTVFEIAMIYSRTYGVILNSSGDKPANDQASDEGDKITSGPSPAAPGREPFERWLDTKLKNVYGSVLAEPIPDDLINLLREKLDKL
jgi:hypothetical protein